MFQRNITDTTGLEPFQLFNVVQFMMYDKDNSGKVTVDETMHMLYARYGKARLESQMKALFGEDLKTEDGDGELSREERETAREAAREERRAALPAKREEMFEQVAGEDGCLDWDEFKRLKPFRHKPSWYVASIFRRVDADDDNCISFEEFTSRLTRQGHGHRGNRGHRRWARDSRHDDNAADRARRRRWWGRRRR